MDYQRRFDQHVGDTSDHVQDRSVNFHMIMELKVSIICRGFGGGFFRQCLSEFVVNMTGQNLGDSRSSILLQTNSTLGIRVDPCVPGHTYSGKRSQMHCLGLDHGPMYQKCDEQPFECSDFLCYKDNHLFIRQQSIVYQYQQYTIVSWFEGEISEVALIKLVFGSVLDWALDIYECLEHQQ